MKILYSLIVLSLILVPPLYAQQSLNYELYDQESGEVIDNSTIEFEHLPSGQKNIRFTRRGGHVETYQVGPNYETLSWSVDRPDQDTSYKGVRAGNTLIIKGKLSGKPVTKNLKIDEKPFYAFPKAEMINFVLSKEKKLNFWAIHKNKLRVFEVVAKNLGIETISFHGQPTDAIRIYWTTKNPLYRLFKRNYYFRKSDGIFIRQEYEDGKVRRLLVNEK